MWSVRSVINIEGGRRGYASHLLTFPVTPEAQAIFFRRRHQPRRPPPANIRPGSPAPGARDARTATTSAAEFGLNNLRKNTCAFRAIAPLCWQLFAVAAP